MPAGLPYFAWIDQSETTFQPTHMRWDEQVFSFALKQDEGDPANLTVAVRRPRNTAGDPIGLLGPGRKIWCWFALDCGPDLIRFRGRLVGIPTSLFEDLVTLEFIAKPVDMVAQKAALANTLRVLPYYDPVVVDPAQRSDPDVVLEGYTKIWHFDRETHVITVSDEITGEDGLVTFDGTSEPGKVLYDGLGLTLTTGPLARVDVNAQYTWTQQGVGTVDLTNYLVSNWPQANNGTIPSYTISAGDWPKTGASIGDGWIAASASAYELNDLTVHTGGGGGSGTNKFPDGSTVTMSSTHTYQYLSGSVFTIAGGPIAVKDNINVSYSKDGDGYQYVSGYSRNTTYTRPLFAMQIIKPTLVAGYTANRPYTENVSFSLFANVQPILTDPDDGEALLINNIRSVNLSDPNEGTPIGDARRRSYIATARGNQSIEHLIALARANLMKRARVVEITFVPKLERMCEITLRKSVLLDEPRVGEATGKIIGYSVALDGADGHIKCEVKIGCTIGRGGTVAAVAGTPTYCAINYVGADYQQFDNRTVLFPLDASVGYQPPQAAPSDDGLNLLGVMQAGQVIDQPLVVKFGLTEQIEALSDVAFFYQGFGLQANPDESGSVIPAITEVYADALRRAATEATFKLKSMSRSFSTDYTIQVTNLQIPTGYDLEAT